MSYRSSLTVHPALAAAVLLAVLGILVTSCSRAAQNEETLVNTTLRPSIDQMQYANVETATFSLG